MFNLEDFFVFLVPVMSFVLLVQGIMLLSEWLS